MVRYSLRADQNPFTGRTRPAGRMLPTPDLNLKTFFCNSAKSRINVFLNVVLGNFLVTKKLIKMVEMVNAVAVILAAWHKSPIYYINNPQDLCTNYN